MKGGVKMEQATRYNVMLVNKDDPSTIIGMTAATGFGILGDYVQIWVTNSTLISLLASDWSYTVTEYKAWVKTSPT